VGGDFFSAPISSQSLNQEIFRAKNITKTTTQFETEAYSNQNSSDRSLDLNDLMTPPKIIRGVFVQYGTKSLMIRTDVDNSFSEVKKAVEAKTGIPAEEQVLAWNDSGVLVDNNKSLRSYGYLGGAFCTLTTA
jgi:hypothetical protein